MDGEDPHDLLADPGRVRPQAHQYLGRHPFALSHDTEEEVLGPDVVVTELHGLTEGQLHDLLGPGREGR